MINTKYLYLFQVMSEEVEDVLSSFKDMKITARQNALGKTL